MEGNEKQNRQYKDSVLVELLTSNKVNIIELYNAINHANLSKDTSIEYINIDSSLYSTMRNDIAFLIEGKIIVLLEHQSTINENMPLRCLLYIARLYEKLIKPEYRYLKKLVKIPKPKFYVLYNGVEDYPERKTLHLSDAFIDEDKSVVLNLDVEVININLNHNIEMLKSCKILNEYSTFVSVARALSKEKGIEGFKEAINYCIEHNILKDYLEKRRSEVYNFLVAEYDYDMDMKMQGQEHYNEGMQQGMQQGMQKGKTEGFLTTARRMKKANFAIPVIQEMTGLSKEEIEKL